LVVFFSSRFKDLDFFNHFCGDVTETNLRTILNSVGERDLVFHIGVGFIHEVRVTFPRVNEVVSFDSSSFGVVVGDPSVDLSFPFRDFGGVFDSQFFGSFVVSSFVTFIDNLGLLLFGVFIIRIHFVFIISGVNQ